MSNTPHDFLHEFPEFKERVHALKLNDQHFTKLYSAYQDCSNALHRIEQKIETPSDAHIEDMKKQRLHLKDQLLAIIHKAA